MRKAMHGMTVPFNIYEFRGSESLETEPMRFNVGGIRLSEAAFKRLAEEISLTSCSLDFLRLWGSEETTFCSALVPVGADIFGRVVIRSSRIPLVESATFNLVQWTGNSLYEVCTNQAVYEAFEKRAAAKG